MSTIRLAIVVPILAIAVSAVAAPTAVAAPELALKRVMLSTGGVGYFEYEATVEGDALLALDVRLDQVDDVLKSIVVRDDAGHVGTIGLPGRAPLADTFRDLPFGADALNSPVALLNALQGAELRVAGSRDIVGRLLRVVAETVELGDGRGSVIRHRVSLITDDGLRQVILEDTDTLRFTDAKLQARIDRALAAIAANRVQDRRRLTIAVKGTGRRRVRVGYVIAAPLWKATYRVVLPPVGDDAGTGRVQGWAVIENMSGADWKNVELTLVSGNPVTFRQALYTAYYVNRPEVPVEVLGRVLPTPDRGAIGAGLMRRLEETDKEPKRKVQFAAKSALADAAVAPAEETMAQQAPRSLAMAVAADAQEATTQVSFRLALPVTVASGASLVAPIIDTSLPLRRMSLFQPRTHPRNPLASVQIDNASGSSLPPGVLTIYERSADDGATAFVGDARLTPLADGDTRLVAYALDQKTTIDTEAAATASIVGATIARGVVAIKRIERQTTTYRLAAPPREPRLVIVEHDRRPGWKLVAPKPKTATMTETAYRFEIALPAGGERTFAATLERVTGQSVQLAALSAAQAAILTRNGEIDPRVRRALADVAERRRKVAGFEQTINDLGRQRERIFREQSRLRDNLQRVPRDSDLQQRYLKKLGRQETALEGIDRRDAEARDGLDAAREALNAYIQELRIP